MIPIRCLWCCFAVLATTTITAIQLGPTWAAPEDSGSRAGGAAAAQAAIILYVDDDAPPGGDGLTWQTAFRYLQDAFSYSSVAAHGVSKIHIAQGTYKPDQGAGLTRGDRDAVLNVPPGIALRGGYAGLLGSDPDAR